MKWIDALCPAVGLIGLWLIDVGQLATLEGLTLTNGLWAMPGVQVYHLGLYMAGGALLLMVLRGATK